MNQCAPRGCPAPLCNRQLQSPATTAFSAPPSRRSVRDLVPGVRRGLHGGNRRSRAGRRRHHRMTRAGGSSLPPRAGPQRGGRGPLTRRIGGHDALDARFGVRVRPAFACDRRAQDTCRSMSSAGWPAKRSNASSPPASARRSPPGSARSFSSLPAGSTNAEIAEQLSISTNTVRTHLHALSVKFEASNRTRMLANARALAVPEAFDAGTMPPMRASA